MSETLDGARDLLGSMAEVVRLDPAAHVFYHQLPDGADDPEEPNEAIVSVTPARRVFNNRYVEALLLQYAQLPSESDKEHFCDDLAKQVLTDPISCATLIRLKMFSRVARGLGRWVNDDTTYVHCLEVIRDTLRYEPHLLANELEEVKKLHDAIEGRLNRIAWTVYRRVEIRQAASQLLWLTAEVPFAAHLRRLKESENLEINADQEQVKQTVHRIGLDSSLTSILEYVEQLLQVGDSDFEFAACLDRLRAFYEGLVKGLTAIVRSSAATRFRGNEGDEGACLQYLTDAGILTSSERDLFKRTYGFLSAEGSHSLVAQREQARIAKNILIELAWLLMQRVQTKYPGTSIECVKWPATLSPPKGLRAA